MFVLASFLLGAGLFVVARLGRSAGPVRFVVAGSMWLVAALGLSRPRSSLADPSAWHSPEGGYVSSEACRSCHPAEFASWHRTFHRTMTELARPGEPWIRDHAELRLDGRSYEFTVRGGELWAILPDLDAPAADGQSTVEVATVERRVELATGSHHYRGYWVRGRRQGELRMFPFVYVFAERRWMPRRDVFLQPPSAPPHLVRWNSNCIQCHATAGRPGHDLTTDRFETTTAELGIACEACHGPGAAHVRKYRNPIARYEAYVRKVPDPSILNPARLAADRSAMVCGQCHAYAYPKDESEFWSNGYVHAYRPGDDLALGRTLLTPEAWGRLGSPEIDASLDDLYWPDGTIRVGGREYNGIVASQCFRKGEGERKLTCLSCHSMHGGAPDDQLASGRDGDEACLGCHDELRSHLASHTHHKAEGAGSRCMSCHMPPTTYALLKVIRSHRIDSPSVESALGAGRPPACNLCHLDRSLGWTRERLAEWYGAPPALLPPALERSPAGVRWLLSGDAAQRVVIAAVMGWPDVKAACGSSWEAPLLAQALDDPYAAVRIVAARSLRSLPGFEDFAYDPLAPQPDRAAAVRDAVARWERATGQVFDARAASKLIADRDDRAVTIAE